VANILKKVCLTHSLYFRLHSCWFIFEREKSKNVCELLCKTQYWTITTIFQLLKSFYPHSCSTRTNGSPTSGPSQQFNKRADTVRLPKYKMEYEAGKFPSHICCWFCGLDNVIKEYLKAILEPNICNLSIFSRQIQVLALSTQLVELETLWLTKIAKTVANFLIWSYWF